jgi:hypothetical protein
LHDQRPFAVPHELPTVLSFLHPSLLIALARRASGDRCARTARVA